MCRPCPIQDATGRCWPGTWRQWVSSLAKSGERKLAILGGTHGPVTPVTLRPLLAGPSRPILLEVRRSRAMDRYDDAVVRLLWRRTPGQWQRGWALPQAGWEPDG